MQRRVDTKQKLSFLRSLLSGAVDMSSLLPARYYTTVVRDGKVTISEAGEQDIEMSPEQYEQWKQTVRPEDVLFETEVADFSGELVSVSPGDQWHKPIFHILQQGNDPLTDDNELQAHYTPSKPIEPTTPAEAPKARKKQKKGLLKRLSDAVSKPEEIEAPKPLATGRRGGISYADSRNDDIAYTMQRQLNNYSKW
jgi:hypothetical protein